jgi:exosome complex RNA-binding protein Rrp42 (RNase PH superfamily)
MNFTQVVGKAFCNFNIKEFLIVKTNSAWVVFVEIFIIKETKKMKLYN